jgi:L-fucose isomerase-like protein
MKKLKVCLCAGSMPYFSDAGLKLYNKHCNDLVNLSKDLNFDFTFYKDPITTQQKAQEICRETDSLNIDFLMLYHPTYISGDISSELMKSRADIGLWAAREPEKNGPLPLASFVCLNQNTSIAGHYFKGNKKKLKWFFGDIKDRYFEPRFEITVKALSAIKNLKDTKVAQIGQIAEGFRNMYYDERDIYRILGIDVVRGIGIEDVLAEGQKIDGKSIIPEVERIYSSCREVRFEKSKIEDAVRIYIATKKICEENNFKAVAFDCAGKLVRLKSIIACLSNSLLNSAGITAGCEGDILSTISSFILKMFSGMPATVSDLPAFDDEDSSVLLWHCGSAPFEMAGKCGTVCRSVYRSDFAKGTEFDNLGPITDMIYPESDATVFRLTGECDHYYYFTGKGIGQDKESWNGSRGWLKDLKLYGKPIEAIDLINTILLNNIQHHYPIVLKDVGKYISEFAYWLDLKKIKRLDYEDFLYT